MFRGILVFLLVTPTWVAADVLTVYSAGPQSLIHDLAGAYQQETGTQVNVFQSTTGQVMARLQSERSNPLADVVVSASWDSAGDLKDQGLLRAYEPPEPERIPERFRDSHYVAQGAAAMAILVNTNRDVPTPTDWDDLARPEYRNEVTMPDPAQSGTAFELVGGFLSDRGDEATWSLFSDLAANGLLVPGPNARALNPVLQGAKSVVFGGVDYIAFGQQARGEALEVIFPDSGTVIAPRPIMIMESSEQPDRAADFVDFVLSDAGQRLVADHYLIPARSDIEGKRPGLDELTVLDVDPDRTADRAGILERFRAATGK